MFRKIGLMASMVVFAAATTFAQESINVKGKVLDGNGEPVIGAAVVVQGTSTGTVTDIDGNYSLTAPSDATLEVSFIGYNNSVMAINGQSSLDFTLEDELTELDELVVVGYGVQKKRDLTGSVSSVKQEDIQNLASANAMQAIQAKVPGVDILQSDGQAGGSTSITLRGNRSILASNGPLVLVDGVEYGSTIDINPSDIESIDILKDAASTAIYGSRGANGVIIITTKRGNAGKTKVVVTAYNSWNTKTSAATSMYGDKEVQRLIDKANYAEDVVSGNWGSASNTAADVLGNNALDDGTLMIDIYNDKSYTNWGELILTSSTTQNYEISITGGNDRTAVSLSAGAMYDEGLMENDKLDRYNGRLSLDHKVTDWLKAGGNILFTYKNNDKRNSGVYSQALKMTTITHAYLSDGSINATPNPMYAAHCSPLLDDVDGAYQNNIKTTRFFGNAYVELTPIKGLIARTQFALDQQNSRNGMYQDYESQQRYQSGQTNYISQTKTDYTGFTWDNSISYNTDFNQSAHELTALVGHELQQKVTEESQVFGYAGSEHLYTSSFYDLSKIESKDATSSYEKYSLVSVFARVNYSYLGKYLFGATMRADGASQLAEDNKWAAFPSVSAGWRIIEEDFMKNSSVTNWLSNLKLRLSWGISGNSSVDAYATLGSLSSTTYYYYVDGKNYSSKLPSSMANSDLSWEKTSSINIGLDFGLFANRVSASVDYYNSKTKDLLWYMTAPASSVYPSVIANVGETKGNGIEIALSANILKLGDFTWDANVSYTHSVDEISALTDGVDRVINGTTIRAKGERVNAYFDYETDGIWNIGEFDEVLKSYAAKGIETNFATGYGTPGSIKIVDRNNDGQITEEDRRVYQQDPDHIIGMNNTFGYKGFSLSVQMLARLGGYLSYDMNSQFNYESANWGDIDYWTPTNTGAKFPSPGLTGDAQSITNTYKSALLYEKADFFKIKDVTLSYNLPKDFIGNIGLASARVYCSMKNYFTWSKIDDYDSERGGSISFPLQKQVVLGINLEF